MSQEKKQPYYLLLLSVAAGIILWLGWPVKPTGFILFFGFVPFLLIDRHVSRADYKRKGWTFFGYTYLGLLIWNVSTTWWVWFASDWASVVAMTANSLLMSVPLLLFHHTRRRTNDLIGYSSFIFYYIAFEYFHLNWDLTWPWLTLGNGFSSLPAIVQWYEYTGHLGGSFWILLMNLLIFLVLITPRNKVRFRVAVAGMIAVLAIPLAISLVIWFTYEPEGDPVEVVVVQPNIDPYEEKFPGGDNFIPYKEQVNRLIRLSENTVTENTRIVAWPETALPYGFFEHKMEDHEVIRSLKDFVHRHPGITLLTGIDSYKVYEEKETVTARYNEQIGFYDAFNTALFIDESKKLEIYHKSKLTPGVESVPPFLYSLSIDLGGMAGSLGRQDKRSVFSDAEGLAAAPVICYESIFGEFVTDYVNEGAELITIITNDGWWGDTPGHRQHLDYARLRAIETRRSVARSANTGISGFIDQRGRVLEKSGWWEQDALRREVLATNIKTFYVKYGDYTGSIAGILSIACLILLITSFFRKKKRGNVYSG